MWKWSIQSSLKRKLCIWFVKHNILTPPFCDLFLDLYQGSYIYKLWNYEKIIFKFIVLSIALAIPGNNLSIIRETTLIKKRLVIKTYNFESNRECSKGWAEFELKTLVVIGTDCTGSCKSNYHTIMTTKMAPLDNKDIAMIWMEYLLHVKCKGTSETAKH
jgi:hypothetical protein